MNFGIPRREPRHVVIGDVHGCLTELLALVERAGVRPTDHLILAGDAVGKGPSSEQVVRWLIERDGPTTLIRGNHEQRIMNGSAREHEKLSSEALAYITDTRLVYRFSSSGRSFVVVHAGIPDTPHLNPASPSLMWRRFERADGSPVRDDSVRWHDAYWANRYDGAHGFAFFGHQPWGTGKPEPFQHATGLDGGCVHGGWLFAAVIDRGEVMYYRERAREVYAENSHYPNRFGMDSVAAWELSDRIIGILENEPWLTHDEILERLGHIVEPLAQELKRLEHAGKIVGDRFSGSKRYATNGAGIGD